MKPKATLLQFLVLAGSSLLAISSAPAATVNWEGDTSATWATAGNWDTAPANSLTTDIANFDLSTYDGVSVFAPTVGTATSINGLTIGASNGTMTLTNTAALGIGNSGISIANGAGAFTISGSTTLGASQSWTNDSANLFTFGAVTAGANTLTVGGTGNTTASGIISGTNGALTKEGAGLLTLNAANTYTGATTVNGGELRWGVANAIAGGALNINDGGTVNLQDKTDTVGTITIAQGGSITGNTGVLTTGSGGLVSNDGGTISGFSAGAGLRLGGGITYNSTGPGSTTLQIDRVFVPDLSPTFNIADGDAEIDFEITGTLSGGGNNIGRNLTKTGAGVMQFSGSEANTTSINQMPLAIWDGTVIFNKSAEVNALPNSNITIGDGTGSAGSAILQYRTSSNQIQNSPITINSDGLFDLNGLSETTSGALTMNGGSLTTGVGTLTLGATTNTISGASTITGNLTFTPGTVAATNLTLGGTASINGTTTFSGGNGSGITATGSTSIAGTLAFGSSTRTIAVTNASDALTITANITGSGALTKTGAGTLQIGDGTTAGTMASTIGLNMGGGTFAILAPTSGNSSHTLASLATTASTGSTIRLTPGASGDTTLTITSASLSTGTGSSLNFDYTAGTTVGGSVGNNYVVWNPTLTGGIIGGAYSVTDSGGTGFATTNGGNVVRLTDPGSAGLPASGGDSTTGSYFVSSSYSTENTTTPGSLVLELSGAVAASNVTVDTTGLASGANLALGTNLLTLGAGMAFNGPNPYEITGSGAGGLKAAASGGTIYLNNGNTSTVTVSAPIVANGAGGVALNGTGTTILSGVNTYTGATLVSGGTLRVANQLALQNSTLTMSGGTAALVFDSSVVGNAFTFGGLAASASGAGFDIALQNNALTPAAIALTVGGNNATTTYSGALSGSGSLTKAGTGVLLLNSTTSSYSGGTVINAGRLNVASDAALGAADGSIILNGGTLSGRTNTLTGSSGGGAINLTTARNVIVTSAGGGIAANGNNFFTTTGVLSGSGTLTFVDVGGAGGRALNFNSTTNDFTGRLVINSNGMTVQVNSLGDTTGAGNIAFNYSGANNGSAFTYGTGATSPLTLDNRAFEFNSGSTMGATLSNANTTHALTINTNLVATGAGAKTLTLSAAAGPTNVFSGSITDGSDGGTVGIAKSGAGTWILSGANSYTGGTTVSAGTLGFANGALGSTGTINASGGTLLWSSGNTQDISSRLAMTAATTTTLNTNGNNVAFATPIGGSTTGALTKAGAGTLLLNGTNTYTGLTTVNDGTLGGSCTIAGAVTVNAAGSLAPGASAGTLAITGNLTLTNQVNGGTGKLKFELGSIAASDKITVGGNLTLGNSSTTFLDFSDFEFSTLAGLQNGTYPLITYAGTLSGNVGSGVVGTITGAGGSADATLQINPTTKTVELVVSNVSGGSPYNTWSGGAPFGGDANGDGVSNGLAFLLGAADPDANATGLLPTVSEVGGNLVMNFTCLATADRGTATLTLEYDGNLAGTWLSVPVPGAVGAPNPIVVNTTTGSVSFEATNGGTNVNGDALIHVVATISDATESASGKLFGRLKGTNP